MIKRLLFLAGFLVLAFALWFWQALKPVSADATPVIITIEKGTSVAGIARNLADQKLIRSASAFKWYVGFRKLQTKLQAGVYELQPSQSVADILAALTTGKTDDMAITIPEDRTVADIDDLLAKKGLGQPGDFIACAFDCDFSTFAFVPKKNIGTKQNEIGSKVEGYLFPDTYFVSKGGYEPKKLIERMLEEFDERVVKTYAQDIRNNAQPLSKIMVMASLIEKETRHQDERAIVSGILWKRYNERQLLGVDATVRYFLHKPTAAITAKDLDTDSPYNTRKVVGLPPTPIANPGEAAILAAFQPESSEYWYYLHDPQGRIHYARTNDEHNENKFRYLR